MPKPKDAISKTILECQEKTTNSECAIPTTSTKSHSIDTHSKATDSVLVASQNTDTLPFQCIPDITGPIVITAEQDSARNRECDGGNSTKDVVMCKGV